MTTKERYKYVVEYFSQTIPEAKTELHYGSAYELIVAVMLSAQCTDKRVNMVTPAFFAQFPTSKLLAGAEVSEVYDLIKTVSYPNSKSQHLVAMAKMLEADYGGVVPSDPEELQKLPGVGRKTANVVASVEFDQKVIAVDTHVFRVANRIGLTNNSKTPLETEKTLTRHFAPELLPKAHHWLILHGRYVCQARKPKCVECGLIDICKYYKQSSKKQ